MDAGYAAEAVTEVAHIVSSPLPAALVFGPLIAAALARMKARGRHCILVVTETGPTDIEGMSAAMGQIDDVLADLATRFC